MYQVDAAIYPYRWKAAGTTCCAKQNPPPAAKLLSIDRAIRGVMIAAAAYRFDYASLAEWAADAPVRNSSACRGRCTELLRHGKCFGRKRDCTQAAARLWRNTVDCNMHLMGDGIWIGCEILRRDNLTKWLIFAQNDAMALGAVDYLHSHGRKPGKDAADLCVWRWCGCCARCRKRGGCHVGALDDTQLAELTADAAWADCEGTVEALYRSGGHRRADGGGNSRCVNPSQPARLVAAVAAAQCGLHDFTGVRAGLGQRAGCEDTALWRDIALTTRCA